MSRFPTHNAPNRAPTHVAHKQKTDRAVHSRRGSPLSNRARTTQRNVEAPYMPPETWHAPHGDGRAFKFVVQAPGEGFRHVLTPEEIRARLAQLPAKFLEKLEVIQLCRMTRKKASFPCYGMQWGSTLYLYPIEESLIEEYTAPPSNAQRVEAKMYGAEWHCDRGTWRLRWDEPTIKDFYLNNILIHELGHILDDRNGRAVDRERYAEWFAVQYGYKPTQAARAARLGYAASLRRHSKQSYHTAKSG